MRKLTVMLVLLLLFGFASASRTLAKEPVVRAVLFWAEGCPSCQAVVGETLPVLQARYGDQLDVQLIEVSETLSYDYFRQVEDLYRAPPERRGVPALFIADQLLVGDDEIPARLPALIEQYLAAGGIGYPNLPDLAAHLPAAQPLALNAVSTLSGSVATESEPAASGFLLAQVVMGILVVALLYALVAAALGMLGRGVPAGPAWLGTLTPILAVIGLGVAVYLTYVETQNVAAVCGPVGDCNAVQASPYARLFGFLPVSLLGAIGYVAILVAWAVGRFGQGRAPAAARGLAELAPLALLGMALFGVLFSIYLTYLELFIIYAVCLWCLTSAVIMAALLALFVGPATAMLGEEES
ncbi:MAG: vitamin K epoxide reductase [Chloroflexi bacterium HGW-Chloroflexi-1]|nr:MAG: vitamin K epoxide reductase [Chloroflexi bacterium HGW-Chloroflexi-1]